MAWYYWGMGFRSKETRRKAKQIAKKNNGEHKVEKKKDPLGGFMYKIYFSKKDVRG